MDFEQTGRPAKDGTLLQTISRNALRIECSVCTHARTIPVSVFVEALGNGATVKDALARTKCSRCVTQTPPLASVVAPTQP